MPESENDLVSFDEGAARRIARVVRRVERTPDGGEPGRSGLRLGWTAKVFRVTTQVAAASAADTPGKGAGTMQTFNIDSGKFEATEATGIDLYNITTAKIIVGAYAQFVVMDGRWFYDVTSCANGI